MEWLGLVLYARKQFSPHFVGVHSDLPSQGHRCWFCWSIIGVSSAKASSSLIPIKKAKKDWMWWWENKKKTNGVGGGGIIGSQQCEIWEPKSTNTLHISLRDTLNLHLWPNWWITSMSVLVLDAFCTPLQMLFLSSSPRLAPQDQMIIALVWMVIRLLANWGWLQHLHSPISLSPHTTNMSW